MPGYDANFRNSGSPTQILTDDSDARGSANPLPIFPPPPEPILNIDCGQTISASITTSSAASLFRTGDPLSNQSYRARLVSLVILAWGGGGTKHVTFTVAATGFDPFVATVRDANNQWYSSDGTGVIQLDVTANNEGPFTVEVTTLSPGQTGSFTLTQTCTGDNLHWSFDNPSSYVDDILGVGLTAFNTLAVTGKIGQAVQLTTGGAFSLGQLEVGPLPAQLSNYAGGSISHAFWIQLQIGTGINPTLPVRIDINGVDGHVYEIDLIIGAGGVTNNNPTFEIIKDPSGAATVVASLTVPITWVYGQWYFLVLTYNQATQKLGYSINGAPTTEGGSAFTIPNGTWSLINLGPDIPFFVTMILDEYLITTEYLLNKNDITALYNSGNALAWPYDIPLPAV